ncbi:MAG: YfcE family phosphodiesterase, partial [Halobacteria archaeon]|nr:YfcE family phosphodiesterase [Halobacteria archaeon]
MEIGLISDVHGNAPALRKVLSHMPDVEKIIHAGDVVGYNPYPSEVIEIFEERGIQSIQGNHDRAVGGNTAFGFNSLAGRAVEWTRENLSTEEIEYVHTLPTEDDFFDGRVHVAHGAPGAPDRYTYPREFSPTLLSDEDVLVLGHTHVQGKRRFDEGAIVNPGSVGQPRDGDPRAAYAVLNFETLEGVATVAKETNLNLLRAIRQHEPGSISELAEIVGRDYREVHRNLEELEELGIVTFEEEGRSKKP